jgi:hypothetical protein
MMLSWPLQGELVFNCYCCCCCLLLLVAVNYRLTPAPAAAARRFDECSNLQRTASINKDVVQWQCSNGAVMVLVGTHYTVAVLATLLNPL